MHTQNKRLSPISLTLMEVKCLKLEVPKVPKIMEATHFNPGPDPAARWRAGLACQDAVMESEAFITSENSCISKSRRARAGFSSLLTLAHF